MDFLSLQRKLEEFGLDIFTLNDVVKISGQKKEVIKSTLSRLVNQNKVFRLKKKYYFQMILSDSTMLHQKDLMMNVILIL